MAVQLSVAVRNARQAAIEATIGTSAIMKFRTGSAPATCATADSGTVVATLNLPSDWLAAPSSGSTAKAGTWQDLTADNSGTIAHFRIYDSGGSACHVQGTATLTGGGGDITLDAVVITAGQPVTVNTFSFTDANS